MISFSDEKKLDGTQGSIIEKTYPQMPKRPGQLPQLNPSTRLPTPEEEAKEAVRQLKQRTFIGHSLVIRGDLMGEERVIIQGKVEGTLSVKHHSITIGKDGWVKGDIHGKAIGIEGRVEGNLYGQEKIIIRQSGHVRGNLCTSKIFLEEGCKVKGTIETSDRWDTPGFLAPRKK